MEKSKYFNIVDMIIDLLINDIEKSALISLPDEGIVMKFKKLNPFFGKSSVTAQIWSNKLSISVKLEYVLDAHILLRWDGTYIDSQKKQSITVPDFKNEIVNIVEND